MMLSEAIRLGAMLREQGTMFFFRNGKTCAVGAAAEACGRLEGLSALSLYSELGIDGFLYGDIWRKNDSGMTREAISDWLVESGCDVEIPGTSVLVEQSQEVAVTA